MAKRKTTKRMPAPKRKTPKKSGPLADTAEESPPKKDAAAEETPGESGDFSSLQKIFDDAAKIEDSGFGLRTVDVECPHCGEDFEISVDPQEEGQEMVQDCQVCCRSITFSVEMEDGELLVSAYQD